MRSEMKAGAPPKLAPLLFVASVSLGGHLLLLAYSRIV
jgi:hypothetical protein